MILDSRSPSKKVQDYMGMETRFKMLTKSKPEDAKELWKQAQHDVEVRYRFYEYMAQRNFANGNGTGAQAMADARNASPKKEDKALTVETGK